MKLYAMAAFNTFRRSWIFMSIVTLIVLLFGIRMMQAHAQGVSVSTARNCDANAVIFCGATSTAELIGKYDSGDQHNSVSSVHNIYSFFGVTSADINAMGNGSNGETTMAGSVTSSGEVFAGGKMVATGALTGGRQDISGSTREDVGGTVFFVRPPSVSFASSPLSAFVVMVNGQFKFAIIASCGNAVKATPVAPAPKPAPKPAPTPAPKPTPTPPPPAKPVSVCSGNTTNTASNSVASQSGNCSTNTTTNTTVVQQQVAQTASSQPGTGQCTNVAVQIDKNNPLTVNATAAVTSNNADVKSVVFDFGDGTMSQPSPALTQSHTFASAGSFTITATVAFTNGAQTVTCQGVANVQSAAPTTTPSAPTPTPAPTPAPAPAPTPAPSAAPAAPSPSALVNTGPGEVVGLFVLTAAGSALGYRWYIARKLAKT